MKRKGVQRKRRSLEIQFWLRKRGIQQKQIAKELKVSEVLVSVAISGKQHGGRVLKHLRKMGVPSHYLGEKE